MRCSDRRFVALGAFVIAANAVAPTLSAHPEPRGIWALDGGTLYHQVHPLSRGAVSPDGRSSVRATSDGLVFQRGAARVNLALQFTPGLAEVVWSPDMRLVAINASSGGAIGTWDTYVLDTRDGTAALPVRQLVEARLGEDWACAGHEAVNLGTVGWERGGALLIVAEAPMRPGCANGGAILGLRVDLARRSVTRVLASATLRQSWSALLGSRFRSLR